MNPRVAFAGTFSATLEHPVRTHLAIPCDVIVGDEAGIVPRLSDVDVLVTLGFTWSRSGSPARWGSRPNA